jgi:penicillin-binding protein-related factor A (putative recombinase)
MNTGKIFEKEWKDSIPENCYYLRIVDPPQSWGDQTNLRFSPKNPFDALMYVYPNLFLLELKSTKGTAFSFTGTSPMIKKHQIVELSNACKFKGIVAGFVFNMTSKNKTYFLSIQGFNKFMELTDKKSINEKDIIEFGGIEVRGEIKKVRTKFYIGELIKKAATE